MESDSLTQTIAQYLEGLNRGPAAFLEHNGVIYFSILPHAPGPFTCVTNLIQGLYHKDPQWARLILRKRIFTTHVPTEMCRGMVQVAAKRTEYIFVSSKPNENFLAELLKTFKFCEIPPFFNSRSEASSLGHHSTYPFVMALLLSKEGEELSWGLSQQSKNKTLHAEVNAIQGYFQKTGRLLPKGSTLFTTLKPCQMCASMILHCAEDPQDFRVVYDSHSEGSHTRNTILDQHTHIIEKRRWITQTFV